MYQVIEQADDPNQFPEGMRFAVNHSTQGTLQYFATRNEAVDWAKAEEASALFGGTAA